MKYYPILLALCQDIGISPMEDNIEIIPGSKKERIALGTQMKIEDVIFGEDANEIGKISKVVSNLFLRVDNHIGSSATTKGALQDRKISIIKLIAETYQDVIIYLVNKNVYPETGFAIDQGVFYKILDEENFEIKLKEANHKIRDANRTYHEAYHRYENEFKKP